MYPSSCDLDPALASVALLLAIALVSVSALPDSILAQVDMPLVDKSCMPGQKAR